MPSHFYYRLPHEWRYALHRTCSPLSHARLQSLRRDGRLQRCDRWQAIFVHVPKCGGTSVLQAVFGDDQRSHYTVAGYQKIFAPREYGSYFKFAAVRNPWARLVSAWHYLHTDACRRTDGEWVARHLTPHRSFDDFVRRGLRQPEIARHMHFRPQHEYLCLPGQRQPLVDQLIRQECLQQSVDRVRERLGLPAVPVPRLNRGDHGVYHDYYSAVTRRVVGEVYGNDIELLGYRY
ncbi:MAG: sulfotransferase family 2 domain-containing protein [Solimonas sp.]